MSESEEKAKGCSCSDSGGFAILFFIVGLAASLIVGWVIFPKLLYSQKKQPFDFNHALHNTLVDGGCESCHFFREDGSYAGVPKLEQCAGCHEDVQGETADEAVFVNEYVKMAEKFPGWCIPDSRTVCSSPMPRMSNPAKWTAKPVMAPSENRKLSNPMRKTGSQVTAGTSGERTSQVSKRTPGIG